jgi:hypothetical protein
MIRKKVKRLKKGTRRKKMENLNCEENSVKRKKQGKEEKNAKNKSRERGKRS